MDLHPITVMLDAPSEKTIESLLHNDKVVFWVDWREEDKEIVDYCEAILKTGVLSAELVGADLYIKFRGKRVKVPLTESPKDRHITICTLNSVLEPEYEVRWVVLSHGSDTLAFLPLAKAAWRSLEAKYPARIAEHFLDPRTLPNIFTELTEDNLPKAAKANYQRMLAGDWGSGKEKPETVKLQFVVHVVPFDFQGIDTLSIMGKRISEMKTPIPFSEKNVKTADISVERDDFASADGVVPDVVHIFSSPPRAAGKALALQQFAFSKGVLASVAVGVAPKYLDELKKSLR